MLEPGRGIAAPRFAWMMLVAGLAGCSVDMDNTPVGRPSALTGAADGGGDDSGPDDPDDETAEADPAARMQIRRLTRSQYGRSVEQLLGGTLTLPEALPADALDRNFTTVGTAGLAVGAFDIEQYEGAARQLADLVIEEPARQATVVGCDPAVAGCFDTFVAAFGRRAFRRPLTDAEQARYVTLAQTVGTRFTDPWRGVHAVVTAMLASPNFIYIADIGESDPDDPERRRYTSIEMASRLSFFLWGHGPDDALLDRAEAGELADDASVDAIAREMLEHPSAREGLARFFREWLAMDAVGTMAKDTDVFPTATPELFASMSLELEQMVNHVVFEQRSSMLDLLDTRTAFVDDRLAAIYGMPATGGAMQPVERAEDDPRSGLLGTAAVMALTSRRARTSPTLRGIFVQQRLRCVDLPPPPPEVDVELPDDPAAEGSPETMREMLIEHVENPACATCHDLVDPLGLALEHFDTLGAWRADDRGLMLDVSGQLDGQPFEDLGGLIATLREDPVVEACMVRQLYRYATGHVEKIETDEPAVLALAETFADVEGDLFEFVPAMVASTAFRSFAEVE